MIRSARECGLLLRSLREDRGLTRQQLAEQAGVSVRWLANFENGKPSVDLSMVFDCFQTLGHAFRLADLPEVNR